MLDVMICALNWDFHIRHQTHPLKRSKLNTVILRVEDTELPKDITKQAKFRGRFKLFHSRFTQRSLVSQMPMVNFMA